MTGLKTWAVEIAAVAIFGVLMFWAGRDSAPKSIRDTKAVQVAKQTETIGVVSLGQATITQTNTVTKYVDRVVKLPSGETIETKTSTVGAVAREEKKATEVKAETKIETQIKTEYRDRLVTLQPRQPRFSVGVNASMGLDLKPHYGAEVGVRVIGPAWLTLGADLKSRAVVGGVELVF